MLMLNKMLSIGHWQRRKAWMEMDRMQVNQGECPFLSMHLF